MAFVPFFDLGAEGAAQEANLLLTFMAFMACIERNSMEFLDPNMPTHTHSCLLYTSAAADDTP